MFTVFRNKQADYQLSKFSPLLRASAALVIFAFLSFVVWKLFKVGGCYLPLLIIAAVTASNILMLLSAITEKWKFSLVIGVVLFCQLAAYAVTYIAAGIDLYRSDYLKDHFSSQGPSKQFPEFKPVLYLYPTKPISVLVKLEGRRDLIVSYPSYPKDGWKVDAFPDGRIIMNQREFSYLFWEENKIRDPKCDGGGGFIASQSELEEFLYKSLSGYGLLPKEYNEFIVFWYPILKANPYNFICFSSLDYSQVYPLSIHPQPDSLLRLSMRYLPLSKRIEVRPPDKIEKIERKGFFALEWGGSEMNPAELETYKRD